MRKMRKKSKKDRKIRKSGKDKDGKRGKKKERSGKREFQRKIENTLKKIKKNRMKGENEKREKDNKE